MASPIAAETIPWLISQSKNRSPASPDQSVPSQSKAATCGLSCNTKSRKSCRVSCGRLASMLFITSTIPCRLRDAQFPERALRGTCEQRGVILGSVDVQGHKRIIHGYILNMLLIKMFNVTRTRGRRGMQKYFDQFTAQKIRMPVLAGKLGHNRPNLLWRSLISIAQ